MLHASHKQVQGLSKAKNKNLVDLCEEAKALKEMFVSFSISHIKKVCRISFIHIYVVSFCIILTYDCNA